MGRIRAVVTLVLDVLALLLVASGFALGLWPLIGGISLVIAGGIVGVGSFVADREAPPKAG